MNSFSRRWVDKMAGDARAKIMDAIASGKEVSSTQLLAILLDVFVEIKDEIASIRGDIPGLRNAVLNGHADVHHADHEWIAHQREIEAARAEQCAWCKAQYQQAKEDRGSRRRIMDTWIADAGKYVMGALLTVIALGVVTYLRGGTL